MWGETINMSPTDRVRTKRLHAALCLWKVHQLHFCPCSSPTLWLHLTTGLPVCLLCPLIFKTPYKLTTYIKCKLMKEDEKWLLQDPTLPIIKTVLFIWTSLPFLWWNKMYDPFSPSIAVSFTLLTCVPLIYKNVEIMPELLERNRGLSLCRLMVRSSWRGKWEFLRSQWKFSTGTPSEVRLTEPHRQPKMAAPCINRRQPVVKPNVQTAVQRWQVIMFISDNNLLCTNIKHHN